MNQIAIKHGMKNGAKRSEKTNRLIVKNKKYKNFKAHLLIWVDFIVFININKLSELKEICLRNNCARCPLCDLYRIFK